MRRPSFLNRPVLDPVAGSGRADLVMRDVDPIEGTRMSLFNTIIPSWWTQNGMNPLTQWMPANGILAERVWVASRCIQMNAQQIASMPIEFHGTTEPQWVSSPDPHWFPNGIGDAIHAIVADLYGWGFSCLYVTDFYADGYPRTWTVLDSCELNISIRDGAKVYKLGEVELDPTRVVQIDRNPGKHLHGSSAIRAYAQQAWGLLAAGNQSMSVNQGAIPFSVLKSARKLTKAQAEALQAEWMAATQNRNGAPPVLPPELSFEELSFNPKDLALLESQTWNATALATAFGVPCVLLNMALTGGLTYQNPAALGEMWWRFELRPTSKRIADALSAQLLPRGQFVSFNAADTFEPLTGEARASTFVEPAGATQPSSTVANASPTQQTGHLSAVTG